ncbi:hypothetical protein [Streptomyces sp. NPDC001250]|uniref:hypothetical protein n=1 Tax=unclassified Streptomyces TaxID=2593676 RepID=UPI00333216C7
MTPTASNAKKPEIPNLPVWINIPVGFLVAFVLGESYAFAWWQRFGTVIIVTLLLESINQAARRAAQRRKSGRGA